jgi:hypothetical protein
VQPASYYMPVVDRPSLLDIATSISPPRNGTLQPALSLLDDDWLPQTGCGAQGQLADSPVQVVLSHLSAVQGWPARY